MLEVVSRFNGLSKRVGELRAAATHEDVVHGTLGHGQRVAGTLREVVRAVAAVGRRST